MNVTYWGSVNDFVAGDSLGLFIDLISDVLRCGATIRHVVFDAEVVVGAPWVVTGGQEDTTVGLVLPDDVGGSGGGEDGVLSNDELFHSIGRADLENRLDSLRGEVSTVSTDDDRLVLSVDGVEDSLDKVLCVVLWFRFRYIFLLARCWNY